MAKFRKKPVEVEAWPVWHLVQWATSNWSMLPKRIEEAYDKGDILFLGNNTIQVKTLEGVMTAEYTDWIICGLKNELYPCKDDIFRKSYYLLDDGRECNIDVAPPEPGRG